MTTWLSIIGGIVGIAAIAARWLWSRRERETGRLESALETARREAERGKERAKIDASVRAIPDSDVLRELHSKWSRD